MKVAAALLVLASVGCTRGSSGRGLAPSGSLRGANILLITVDTLRRDRVGAYGNRSGLTPNLDRFAASAVRYTHAFTPAPLTLPAHASILTGLLPQHHGIHNNTLFRLDERVPTLASLAKSAGYRTGAFVGAFVLDGRFGLNHGFDEYDDHLPHSAGVSFHFSERRAADVVRLAIDWIVKPGRGPWFAWIHLFDPHAPYAAPPDYRAGRSAYDAEVAYTDSEIGRLFASLDAAHALDRTLIVVTADHGESLGEHGETTHGLFAYNATLAVPLLVGGPSIRQGVIDAPVSHVDVAPTVLDLVGIARPERVDGTSLARTPPSDRAVYFEALDAALTHGWAALRGVIQSGWKYIELPDAELYDLSADPREERNVLTHDARAENLRRLLSLMTSDGSGGAPRALIDADAASRLRALGYTTAASPHRTTSSVTDPKQLVSLNERFNSALTAFDSGRPREALAEFLAITRERPDFAAARSSAAMALVAAGEPQAAATLLDEGLEADPESPELLATLGTALRAAGNLRGSAAALERARAAGNENPEVVNGLAVAYAGLKRADEARAAFRQLLARDPSSATSWFNAGLFELQAGRRSDAADAFRRAVALEPSYGEAWQALGAALLSVDKRGAIDAWRRAERLTPEDYDLLFNLGTVLADGDTPAEAVPYLDRFVREAPPARYAADLTRVRARLRQLEHRTP